MFGLYYIGTSYIVEEPFTGTRAWERRKCGRMSQGRKLVTANVGRKLAVSKTKRVRHEMSYMTLLAWDFTLARLVCLLPSFTRKGENILLLVSILWLLLLTIEIKKRE